ncbi:hypothetical protein Droror1_Dr00026809 [Drosera rotundifolia]
MEEESERISAVTSLSDSKPATVGKEADNVSNRDKELERMMKSTLKRSSTLLIEPRNVITNLSQGSAVKSLDFHPLQQVLLLVGTNMGEVMASLASDYTASINRVMWSPDGNLFGVAYSKHIVHIYSYSANDLKNNLEIEAHVGSVNDLAFFIPRKLCKVVGKIDLSSCGMQLMAQNSLFLRVMKRQCILYVGITRKIFR